MNTESANRENKNKANDFLEEQADVNGSILQLQGYIKLLPSIYRECSREQLQHKTAPGKWCRQEILGHLVDSAVNNLKRFTDIQCRPDPYTIQSYQQDALVIVNDYINLPLEHVLQLWISLNQQIIYVAENVPAEILLRAVHLPGKNRETKTLGWLITDYVEHLQHHLQQLG